MGEGLRIGSWRLAALLVLAALGGAAVDRALAPRPPSAPSPAAVVAPVCVQRTGRPASPATWTRYAGPAAQAAPWAVVAAEGREPYHRPDCEWARRIGPAGRREFASAAEAEAAGHRPCRVCRPDPR